MRLTAADLEHAVVPIDSLRPFPGNARIHDDQLLDESITEHGVYRTVVVSSDGYLLAGNGTWLRAKEAGDREIAVTRLPLPHSDPQARKILLVDNRANDRASYDNALLADLLTAVPDLAGTGYGQDDLAELARLVEIDPTYVDVTCRRFQEFTRILPVLEATGEEHDFTAVAANTAA